MTDLRDQSPDTETGQVRTRDVVDDYLESVLRPHLATLTTLTPADQKLICADVEKRLRGLLVRWKDRVVRDTLLLPCVEQAIFYHPMWVTIERRSLVVATIRNSILEDLGTDRPKRPARISLEAPELMAITFPAVEFWGRQNLGGVIIAPPSEESDPFDGLDRRYPRAWAALQALVTTKAPAVGLTLPDAPVPLLPPAPRTVPKSLVLSGMDPSLDARLLVVLHAILEGQMDAFVADSWKAITRNIEKLLFIIEVLLAHGKSVVTSNYLITLSSVARRVPLIKPGHTVGDMKVNLRDRAGLTSAHAQLLKAAAVLG